MNEKNFQKAIEELIDKGMSREKVHEMVQDFIKAAYKRKYGTDENCYVEISEDSASFNVYMTKIVVADDDCSDTLLEIALSEAKEVNNDADVGDEILIPIDVSNFNRIAVMNGKQRFRQQTREYTKNAVFSEFKTKEHQIILGYVVRTDEKGDVYVELGSGVEGRLAKNAQIPGETFKKDDKIKCYLEEVRNTDRGVDIVLSRASGDFVKRFFELQVPEIGDKVVEIYKVSRKAGYRTKLAVYTNTPEVDPVGACVGLHGQRIQAVMNELSGEKVDIVPYDPDPKVFIEAALSPATVSFIRIVDYTAKKAYAVVEDSQLAYAIGKGGMNVQLANKLTDWLIDIKTQEQYDELDLGKEVREDVERLFQEDIQEDSMMENEEQYIVEEEEDGDNVLFADLPFKESVISKIEAKGINSVNAYFDNEPDDPKEYFGFTDEEDEDFNRVLQENLDISYE